MSVQFKKNAFSVPSEFEGLSELDLVATGTSKRRALVVDNSPDVLQALSSVLTGWGYTVVTATDGLEARSMLRKMNIPLVIMDWQMPGMNGVELCESIRTEFGLESHYLIMLVAELDKEPYEEFLTAGIDDFLRKPLDLFDVHARIRSAERTLNLSVECRRRGIDIENLRRRAAPRHLARLAQDIHAAAAYQLSEIPPISSRQEKLQFETIFQPASSISGDTYNYFSSNPDWVNFYSIDVAGHGIASGLLAVTLNTVLKEGSCAYRFEADGVYNVEGKRISTPAELCADLNETFLTDGATRPYFTMMAGSYNTNKNHLRVCLAGHPPPILIRKSGEVVVIGESGFPVGLIENADYDNISVKIEKGDRFVSITDGVTECEHAEDGRQFGHDRVVQSLLSSRDYPLRDMIFRLRKEIDAWGGDTMLQDDLTILSFERKE